MQVKMFMDTGFDAIESVEKAVNEWLAKNSGKISIKDKQVCVAGGIGVPDDMYSIFVVCVWFTEARGARVVN